MNKSDWDKLKQSISISLHWKTEKRIKQYQYAKENGFGVEIISFSYYLVWENNYKKLVNEYKKELRNINTYISFHGPITDIIPHSNVSIISEIASDRIRKSIEIALELQSKRIVFHTGINSIITDQIYIKNTINKQVIFWKNILNEFKNIEIVLENMWEKDPGYLSKICEEINSLNFGMCFDIGHANVYSEVTNRKWYKCISKYLKHIHISDNKGKFDEHLAIGKGNIEFSRLFKTFKPFQNLRYVLELENLEDIKESIQQIRKM